MYVWFDALTNYITSLGYGSENEELVYKYLPNAVHVVGKDILRFHAVYWPAFLMAAGLPLPKTIFGHGWWLKDGGKMSKSVGNVVRPQGIMEEFGSDALRYYLAKDMSFGEDASYSDEAMLERLNTDLANKLGNLCQRTFSMIQKYVQGVVPVIQTSELRPQTIELKTQLAQLLSNSCDEIERYRPHRALVDLALASDILNQYVDNSKPWAQAKEDIAALGETLYYLCDGIAALSHALHPFMPKTMSKLRTYLQLEAVPAGRPTMGTVIPGINLKKPEGMFPRVDIKKYFSRTVEQKPKPTKDNKMNDTSESNLISIDDFFKTSLKVGKIIAAESIPKSKKLLKFNVDIGEDKPRQILAGISASYAPEDLIGKHVAVVANLKPAKLMGIESQGMMLAVTIDGLPKVIEFSSDAIPGTKIS